MKTFCRYEYKTILLVNFIVNLKTKFYQNPVSTDADKPRQTF